MDKFQSGTYSKQRGYKSFQPSKINRFWSIDDMALLHLLGKADRHIGRLDMYSEHVPNIDLFVSMHVLKEATQSSKIEGTKTSIEDALLERDEIQEEKRDDWVEVWNYIEALNEAIGLLNKLPISTRLIKQTHKILMQGVRGERKLPGEFRSSQNWIGGATLADAVFIPPVQESVGEYMSDLEKFIHNDQILLPELLKIALIHYQFETIHPFLDGNGRIGRLLIPLYLVEKEILKKPILYLSDFLENNRSHYYNNLTKVREENDLLQWFKFFLVGIIETAKKSADTFDKILKLEQRTDEKIQALGPRAAKASKLINHLYQHPIISPRKARQVCQTSSATIYALLASMEKVGILREFTGSKRGKMYVFEEYFELFKT